jgi:predicted protein tyrosine phosphatase
VKEYIKTMIECYDSFPKIFSCEKASYFKPENNKTILIRILDSYHQKIEKYPYFIEYPKILHEKLFFKVIEIYCDDVDELKWENKEEFKKMCIDEDIELFDEKMAKELKQQLNEIGFNNKDFDLVVHCRAGVSRSSAIFKGLNEIYDLGYLEIEKKYPHYNNSIYKTLIGDS